MPNEHRKKTKNNSKKSKNKEEYNVNNEDENELLLASTKRASNDTLTPEQKIIYDKTRRAIIWGSRCLYINAFFVEGPLCVIEGILRVTLLLVIGLIMLIASFFVLKWLKRYAILFIKESLISLSALISLILLPGSVLCIYRWYNDDNDWDLAPIPTFIGWVDARRFITFTHGNGSLAKNVKVKDKKKDKVKKKSNDNDIHSNLLAIDHKCQDSCNKIIIFAPRVITSTFSKISKGATVEMPFFIDDNDYYNDNDDNDDDLNHDNDENKNNDQNDNI